MTVKTAVGFAMRAGKCVAGDFACEKAVKSKKARLVLVDSMASEATRERYVNLCRKNAVPCIVMDGMGDAIGKSGRMIAAIVDERFANMIFEAHGKGNNHGGVC